MPTVSEDLLRHPEARVRHLCEIGSCVPVDDNIPPRRYFRSGMEMIRMANVYYDEGNLENAFILYSKFITLFVEKLPIHAGYKSVGPEDKIQNKKKLKEVFPRAEKLKQLLLKKYSEERIQWEEEQKRREAEEVKEKELQRKREEELKKKEEEKRRFEQEKQWLLLQEKERQKLFNNKDNQPVSEHILDLSLDDLAQLNIDDTFDNFPSQLDSETNDTPEPLALMPQVPDRQLKPAVIDISDPLLIYNRPAVDRSTKPSSQLMGGTNGNQFGLREVIIPSELLSKFLKLAEPNSSIGVETCGILAGKLSQNAFTITDLLIPKQSGTPDSCSTENEEEIFDYQDNHDLITLGWIHTHPSQTAFMSSVDLHTHCSYQLMMPEAIAIVCSPKYNETGVFTLTQDYGLQFIANCRQVGFHPHPNDPPLYSESSHAKYSDRMSVKVIDLRKTTFNLK